MLALMRLAIGATLLVVPRRFVQVWTGEASERAVGVPARALGVRELALGFGTLSALGQRASLRAWVRAGVLCDASDALIAIVACRRAPPLRRALWTAAAALAAAAGRRSAASFK